MRAGRSEVIDIFRRWSSDEVLVRWQGTFAKFAFSSWGYILSANDGELRVASNDMKSELVVNLGDELEFDYADSRTVTGEEKKFEECIIIIFECRDEGEKPDLIALAALKAS